MYVGLRVLITARIRRMGEGNVLTHVCPSIHDSVCPQGGVSPQSSWGGGCQVKGQSSRGEGVRSSQGGCQVQPGEGSGPTKGGRGGQVQSAGGRGGGEHLAPSCGWYASCVHAGGLYWFNKSIQTYSYLESHEIGQTHE